MNKQYEMGKTMFEVMKMRKNNKETPFQLRKYYGIMIVVFTLFLGIMAYYSATFRQCYKQDHTNNKDDNSASKRKNKDSKCTSETYYE